MATSNAHDRPPSMLRPATPSDTSALIVLAIATGMFLPHEVEPLQAVFDDFHAEPLRVDQRIEVWADDPSGPPVGMVYFSLNPMSDRTWDLWMIAVAPERQDQGIGSELVRFTEAYIRASGGRLLLIDTSSLPKYDATRAFYSKHGYDEVARIPDFYTDGDSKVIYAKRIAQG
ncbi:MAG: N-acetyltransferase [Chloroflexi bacterium]|nr:N-acetyltransferase [Chloroflexota bacterium]